MDGKEIKSFMKKCRADALLYEQLNLESIQLAQALIMEGRVMSGDRKILRISEMVKPEERLRVRGELDSYVSRGAHKLKRALEVFQIDLNGKICMDVGASTGGFTDVMLRAGAEQVYSIDVGYNLLDYRLRSNARVVCMERTNARFLQADSFSPRPVFGATDVSFISLKAVLPSALSVLAPGGRFVALIKPQFEAEKEEVGEKGVVRDPAVHERVLRDITAFIPEIGWQVNGLDFSPIRGSEGNIEFLMDIVEKGNMTANTCSISISDTIRRAYDKFLKST